MYTKHMCFEHTEVQAAMHAFGACGGFIGWSRFSPCALHAASNQSGISHCTGWHGPGATYMAREGTPGSVMLSRGGRASTCRLPERAPPSTCAALPHCPTGAIQRGPAGDQRVPGWAHPKRTGDAAGGRLGGSAKQGLLQGGWPGACRLKRRRQRGMEG